MHCLIDKIHIINFMSFADQEFDFAKNPGISTIIGLNSDIPGATNGSGKSTLFLAIYYALFGKDAIKTKNKFLKNRYVKSNIYCVKLNLTIDKKKFKVERGSEDNNSFLKLYSILENGQENEITKASINETEAYLQFLLSNLTPDIFLKTVLLSPVLGQNFFLLNHKDKAEFLNLLSGTKVLYDVNNILGKDINSLSTDIKIIDNSLMSLSKQNDVLNEKKNDFIQKQNELRQIHDQKKKELEYQISVSNTRLIDLLSSFEDSRIKTENIEKELKVQEDEQSKIKMSIVAKASEIKSIQSKNDQIDKFIEKNKNIREVVCNDCLTKIDNVLNITTLLNTKKNNEESIEAGKNELTNLQNSLQQIKLNDTREMHINAKKNTDKLNNEINILKNSIQSNKMMIDTLENNYKLSDKIEPFSEMIINNENEIKDKLNQKKQQARERQKLSILKFMTDDDIIHKFVTSQFAKDINIYMTKYLAAMGVNYTVTFDNSFNYEFMTPGGEVSYDTFSSGEKMRLNIAISFAFRRLLFKYLNINVNLLVLDEYVDSALDKLAINGIINLLNEIKMEEPYSSIFVISHRSEILSQFGGNQLTICKSNGISKIIEDDL